MRVILGLLIWSLAEISAYVVVGGWIGLAGVLGLVLGTGLAGVLMLRRQGVALAGAVQRPGGLGAAGQAGLIALAAVLLILPGLLTDLAGLALLLPPVRRFIATRIGARVVVAGAQGRSAAGDVIDATAVEVDSPRLREPSGWTKP